MRLFFISDSDQQTVDVCMPVVDQIINRIQGNKTQALLMIFLYFVCVTDPKQRKKEMEHKLKIKTVSIQITRYSDSFALIMAGLLSSAQVRWQAASLQLNSVGGFNLISLLIRSLSVFSRIPFKIEE